MQTASAFKSKLSAFLGPNAKKRFLLMLLGVFGMGFFLSFLIETAYGSDTCTFMNLPLSAKFGLTFGTWQLCLNIVMLIGVILMKPKLIGAGTIANMVGIGYISDFCRWLWARILPESLFTLQPARSIVFVLALIPFILSIAIYMVADMGLSPFDALPVIFTEKLGLRFSTGRMIWDFAAIGVGLLAGGKLNIGTFLLALTLGPVVGVVDKFLKKHFLKLDAPQNQSDSEQTASA
ncbi:MAG: hypothetical protein E7319_05115 [Clostridiales bacterium]|nr:hypothetical protein [Clostridiales bacterium]